MNTVELNAAAIQLRKGEIHRIRNGLGRQIEALSGCLWVTIDNDLRDIFVSPGDGFRVDRRGDTLVSAMTDSRYVVLEPMAWKRAA